MCSLADEHGSVDKSWIVETDTEDWTKDMGAAISRAHKLEHGNTVNAPLLGMYTSAVLPSRMSHQFLANSHSFFLFVCAKHG